MSYPGKKKLFFVKSFTHNLRAVENFLSKRNFEVFSETDVKGALEKIFEVEPDFIFLAWDHEDQSIINLPKLIAQASLALVVPYINSNKKNDTRRLNICPLNPKLYPPLSGPTIERLILKADKKNSEEETLFQEGQKVKRTPTQSLVPNKKSNMTFLKSHKYEKQHQLVRNQSISKRNNVLKNSKNLNLSDNTINELKKSFEHKIKAPLESLLNSLQEPENNDTGGAYCMSIYSDIWCGYLIITTSVQLEFSVVDIVFSEWLKVQFDNLQEIDEYDYFEIKNIDSEMITELTKNADYFEAVKINNYEMNLSFFPINPAKMALEFNADQDLIKIPTQDIPADFELNFSLYLHLPENKKYLLYTQAQKALTSEQKDRLLTNKIQTLYTSLEFEKEYKKFMAIQNVKNLYKNLLLKNSAE